MKKYISFAHRALFSFLLRTPVIAGVVALVVIIPVLVGNPIAGGFITTAIVLLSHNYLAFIETKYPLKTPPPLSDGLREYLGGPGPAILVYPADGVEPRQYRFDEDAWLQSDGVIPYRLPFVGWIDPAVRLPDEEMEVRFEINIYNDARMVNGTFIGAMFRRYDGACDMYIPSEVNRYMVLPS